MDNRFEKCLCCGFDTVPGHPPGTYHCCEKCGWIDELGDDGSQYNKFSLAESQVNYVENSHVDDDSRQGLNLEIKVEFIFDAFDRDIKYLTEFIGLAFDGVTGDIGCLQRARDKDIGIVRKGEVFENISWESISIRDLEQSLGFAFLTCREKRFVLPALLMWIIDGFSSVCSVTADSVVGFLSTNGPSSDCFETLTSTQKQAVFKFLVFCQKYQHSLRSTIDFACLEEAQELWVCDSSEIS